MHSDIDLSLTLEVIDLVFLKQGKVGSILKLEPIYETHTPNKVDIKQHKLDSFQMTIDPENLVFYGNVIDIPVSDLRSNRSVKRIKGGMRRKIIKY